MTATGFIEISLGDLEVHISTRTEVGVHLVAEDLKDQARTISDDIMSSIAEILTTYANDSAEYGVDLTVRVKRPIVEPPPLIQSVQLQPF